MLSAPDADATRMPDQKVVDNLERLRSLCRKDPSAYRDEFTQQFQHFEAQFRLLAMTPGKQNATFLKLLDFLGRTLTVYKDFIPTFTARIFSLLEKNADQLDPETRRACVQTMMILRNQKHLKDVQGLVALFFRLFQCHDKPLRKSLHEHLVADCRRMEGDQQQVRRVQGDLYRIVSEDHEVIAPRSLAVVVELYRRKTAGWMDERTVNVIADATLSAHPRTATMAIHFFLDEDKKSSAVGDDSDDEDADDDTINDAEFHRQAKDIYMGLFNGSKRTRTKKKDVRRQINKLRNKHKRSIEKEMGLVEPGSAGQANFPALDLIRDPQALAEKLLARLRQTTAAFDVRLLYMGLISRLIGVHQLQVLNFYPFLQRYINPHQDRVLQILANCAQATHDLVPPDAIEPVVRQIADRFVTDRADADVICAGLNAIREICHRQPLAMDDTLLQDLVQYRRFKDKGVMTAGRSLLQLFRAVNPELLARKDRGKDGTERLRDGYRARMFGEGHVARNVDGAELLELVSDAEDSDDYDEESDAESVRSGASDEEDVDAPEGVEDGTESESDNDGSVDHEEGETGTSVGGSVAGKVDSVRLLTDEDFQRIRELKEAEELGTLSKKDGSAKKKMAILKRRRELAQMNMTVDASQAVDASELEGLQKRRRRDLEERLRSVMEGREGRKFVSKKEQKGGGTTNRDKLKSKPLMMVLKSKGVTQKSRRGRGEKNKLRDASEKKQIKFKIRHH